MIIKLRILLATLMLITISSKSFTQDVLMTIAGKDISVDEFERIYKKNNNSLNTNQQTPEEYLELFINFKLKVTEAEALGMDTTESFLKEFNKYKEQLAEPYLADEETKEELMREAYERARYDVRASHILLSFNNNPNPSDTLATYEKAIEIRNRILAGEDFATVARATSDDPSARTNGGDLGYFTVFNMLYQFETMAYKLKPGEISMPVRTRYGYHIIKLADKRPAVGQVKIAHIFVASPEGYTESEAEAAKARMYNAYDSILNGSDFGEIAKRISEDKNSARNGGEIPFFGPGRMFLEFENTAFGLKNPGDLSEPLRSFYGWHLIKLIEKKPIGSYEEMESELQSKALVGGRNEIKRSRYIAKLKREHQYNLNQGGYNLLSTIVDSSIYKKEWNPYASDTSNFAKELFSTSNGSVSIGKFINQLYSIQRRSASIPVQDFVKLRFNDYLEEYMIEIEKASLPQRYPEYKYILQEYHDGILLFDLMDKKVWTHAVEDTLGLERFYETNKMNYMWDERVSAYVVSCDSSVNVALVKKKASKIASGKWDAEKLNGKFCSSDTIPCITINLLTVEDGQNAHIDALRKKPGSGEIYNESGRNKFVVFNSLIPPSPKELNETRGQVTSDYQDQLEKLWIEELRAKYDVNVNMDLLSKIKQ